MKTLSQKIAGAYRASSFTRSLRRDIDARTISTDTDRHEVTQIAMDALGEERYDESQIATILSQVAPVVLGKRTFRVVASYRQPSGSVVMVLLGPRGGVSYLVDMSANVAQPRPSAYHAPKLPSPSGTWYRINPNGSYQVLP